LKKAVKKTVGRWSNEERRKFSQAVELYGDNWEMVEEFVGSRSSTQILNYAMKEFGTLTLDKKVEGEASYEELISQEEAPIVNNNNQAPLPSSCSMNTCSS
jgi:hypothetical protein